MAVALNNSMRLLKGASKRGSFISTQGGVVALDLDMINTVINNLDASIKRLSCLFNEQWKWYIR